MGIREAVSSVEYIKRLVTQYLSVRYAIIISGKVMGVAVIVAGV
jgi:hypothetical protein